MKLNIKQISFVTFGLIIITAIFMLIQLNIATAAKEDGKKFGDWTVSCSKEDKKAKKPAVCILVQQVNISQDEKQQPIGLFQIGYFGDKKELILVETLPLGVNLKAGTAIISAKTMIAPGQYTTCLNNGCNATAPISDADLKKLLSNNENSVAFMSMEGKQFSLPISVKGLKKGLQYIK